MIIFCNPVSGSPFSQSYWQMLTTEMLYIDGTGYVAPFQRMWQVHLTDWYILKAITFLCESSSSWKLIYGFKWPFMMKLHLNSSILPPHLKVHLIANRYPHAIGSTLRWSTLLLPKWFLESIRFLLCYNWISMNCYKEWIFLNATSRYEGLHG